MRRSAAPSRSLGKQAEKRSRVPTDVSSSCPHTQQQVEDPPNPEESSVNYYEVVYAKLSTKKHKKWEGDGFVVICGRYVKLISETGKTLSTGSGHKLSFLSGLEEGSLVKIGGFEAELLNHISASTYQSKVTGKSPEPEQVQNSNVSMLEKSASSTDFLLPIKLFSGQGVGPNSSFKTVMNPSTDLPETTLVMPRPPSHCVWVQNLDGLPITDVVLSPRLTRRLRPHQKEGIQFLYECLMGFKYPEAVHASSEQTIYGCILADEMGLGKTIQAIATLWMLRTQGPYGGHPVVNRCLIVTPSSLIENWAKEITKWVGREQLPYYCVTQNNTIKAYIAQSICAAPVLIMSYEMFLQHASTVCEIPNLDMVICDEGHRLKNAGIHTSLALRNLPARRRLLLTGTPVQNQLDELWSLAEFCAPGRLSGSQDTFRRQFVLNRSNSMESDRTSEFDESESPQNRLSRLLSTFLLRRTVDVIQTELTTKNEFVVFCRQSSVQAELEAVMREWVQNELNISSSSRTSSSAYLTEVDEQNESTNEELVLNEDFEDLENRDPCNRLCPNEHSSGFSAQSILCAITAFRKMYNHPTLLFNFIKPIQGSDNTRLPSTLSKKLLDIFKKWDYQSDKHSFIGPDQIANPQTLHTAIRDSGKLATLAHMLQRLFPRPGPESKHKLVLVSNFTQTLDLLEAVCRTLTKQTVLRLDGQTPNKHRLALVQEFNDRTSSAKILLLSSRAGGTGLNLVGADHLVLFDMDWNPASDAQAMARIWRPGQFRPVRLYRLVTSAGLEERMFQRQVAKLALSHCIFDVPWDDSISMLNANSFKRSGVLTREELRDLFQSPNPDWISWTHELIGCQCQTSISLSSPSLSTDSEAPANELEQLSPNTDFDFEEEESEQRLCQLGPSNCTRTRRSASSMNGPTSESLACLLNWTHSLSQSAIAALGDPLLSASIADDITKTPPVCAVFSLVTGKS